MSPCEQALRVGGHAIGFASGQIPPMMAAMNQPDPVLEEARRAGIDLDLLDSNLALTVKERWERHDSALELALKLEAAGKARDARFQPTSAATRSRS